MNSLLSKEACAAKAGISVRALDYHFAAGTGPRRTFVGNRTFIDEADCFAWIMKRRRREGERRPADNRAEETAPAT